MNHGIREPRTGMSKATLRETKNKKNIEEIKKYKNNLKLKKNNNHTRPGSGPLRLVLRANPPGEYKI